MYKKEIKHMQVEDARSFFAKDLFATETVGIEIVDIEENYCKTKLKVEKKHLNANNTVMGGCIYTLVDFTFAIASNVGNNPTSTLTSNIVYNAPAVGEYLYAESSVVKNGRSVATYTVSVTDENGKLIATATSVGFRKA